MCQPRARPKPPYPFRADTFTRVHFPTPTAACYERSDGTPTSGVACDLPGQSIKKLAATVVKEGAPCACRCAALPNGERERTGRGGEGLKGVDEADSC